MGPKILLIGDICVDVILTHPIKENSMRLGGIMHAARTLWALGISYDLAYVAPQYLFEQIDDYAKKHSASAICNIGIVNSAPNVAIIAEPTESGPQGYEVLLRESYKAEIDREALETAVNDSSITDIMIFPGDYNLELILGACSQSKAKIHIDIAHGIKNVEMLDFLGKKFDTGITSTSSDLFINQYESSVTKLCQGLMGRYFETFLFKENRGGARLFIEHDLSKSINVGAQVHPIVHSIGVGDCFNSAYIALSHKRDQATALTYASWIAGEYASTTYPDDFKKRCDRVMMLSPEEIVELKGISVPWELRPSFNMVVMSLTDPSRFLG